MKRKTALITEMSTFDKGDAKRIQHFIKVFALCSYMAQMEGLSEQEISTLEIAAILHDIGVIPSEKEFGNCAGPHQEAIGPSLALDMMAKIETEYDVSFSQDEKDRVCYLIAHHHTYNNIDGLDYQILVEADFLVNLYEKSSGEKEIRSAYDKIFVTATGKKLCEDMFLA